VKADFGRIHWGRVLLAGALAAGLSVALAFLVVAVDATSLAFQARTQPDQTQIAAFAAQFADGFGRSWQCCWRLEARSGSCGRSAILRSCRAGWSVWWWRSPYSRSR